MSETFTTRRITTMLESTILEKIISGGQTGADFGGLLAGKFLNIETGGWCPAGWRTEKGKNIELKKYGLQCTEQSSYPPRTHMNVKDSDGTIMVGNFNSKGLKLTKKYCVKEEKPFFELPYPESTILQYSISSFRYWMVENKIKVLNVAGNRETTNKGIEKFTKDFLVLVFAPQLVENNKNDK